MRWEYSHLNTTPYLYSSGALRDLYSGARSKKEKEAIYNHMERHEAIDAEYPGFYRLAADIEEEIGEKEPLEWGDIFNNYEPVMTKKGLELKKRRKLL